MLRKIILILCMLAISVTAALIGVFTETYVLATLALTLCGGIFTHLLYLFDKESQKKKKIKRGELAEVLSIVAAEIVSILRRRR
jgi:hypothetical protein